MNRQCILHELVRWLTKKVLSARSQLGYNKTHNFELWCNVGMYLADRQKSRGRPVPVRRSAVEKHCITSFTLLQILQSVQSGSKNNLTFFEQSILNHAVIVVAKYPVHFYKKTGPHFREIPVSVFLFRNASKCMCTKTTRGARSSNFMLTYIT